MSWYPLGRPVGTTIYPGMQITSVAIWKTLRWLSRKSVQAYTLGLGNVRMSLNDVCVFVPAWFGSIASVLVGLLTVEVYHSWFAGGIAALIMSVIPAHIMRSVGGGYDNESIAMSAMCLTFWAWCWALKHHKEGAWLRPTVLGIFAGLSYAYMIAAWGGFIFVGNMVAVHTAVIVALGYYSSTLHIAYTWFYVVATSIAVQIPVVNWSPFRSAEQLGLLAVFLVLHVFAAVDWYGARVLKAQWKDPKGYWVMYRLRASVVVALALLAGVFLAITLPLGYFGGLSIRVRSLFIKHTKTGNPLVDSVAEHQPASTAAYWHYLNYASYLSPVGLLLALFRTRIPRVFFWASAQDLDGVSVNKWFIITYALVAYYFSARMQRLIILLGPVASVLGGIALATALEWSFIQGPLALGIDLTGEKAKAAAAAASAAAAAASAATAAAASAAAAVEGEVAAAAAAAAKAAAAEATPASPTTTDTPSSKSAAEKAKLAAAAAKSKSSKAAAASAAGAKKAAAAKGPAGEEDMDAEAALAALSKGASAIYNSPPGWGLRLILATGFLFLVLPKYGNIFYEFSDKFAQDMSQPSIMFKAKLKDGQEVMINDYVEGYHWLRDNTPQDARVLSWWDYGYQITGIGNRTSLADGNTWNLEHIALLGRMLTSPEKRAWSLARHLADYVLIWAGNQGDDLSKSPHMARIGSSVYPDICPKDPLCRNFGFHSDRSPTPSMAA
jgi:dolichyl-diphosphooligosaccharide--protein glycosyltransferase